MQKLIYIADDEQNIRQMMKAFLESEGYAVEVFSNGAEIRRAVRQKTPDMIILDVMMPKKDGFTLAKEVRQINSEIPIIFLTAKSMKEDVLEGFKLGADDYMSKPFSMEELLLRIEAVLRRSTGLKPEDEQEIFKIGKLTFNSKKQTLFDGEEEQKLTTKESELLRLLCLNVNKVLERNYALKNIWADDNYFNARSMDVYITKLRKHLKKDPSVEIINVHGKGYKLIL